MNSFGDSTWIGLDCNGIQVGLYVDSPNIVRNAKTRKHYQHAESPLSLYIRSSEIIKI